MNAKRRTMLLGAALALAVVVDVVAHVDAQGEVEALPSVPEVEPATVTTVTLTKGDEKIAFRREGPEAWQMTAPFDYAADHASVQAILAAVRNGVPMDVRVDAGKDRYEAYGLDTVNAVLVELGTEAGPAASFYVGFNTAGGSTFVRLPDSEDIYRARIGGRARYDRPAGDWRDHRVFGFTSDLVDRVAIARSDASSVVFVRESEGLDDKGNPKMGPWRVEGAPGFPLDQRAVDEAVGALGHLRAGDILSPDYPAGLDRPAAVVELHLATEENHAVRFGRTSAGVFARRGDDGPVFRVAPSVLERLDAPLSSWRDRTLFSFDRGDVWRVSLVEPQLTTVLQQDPATSNWTVIEPKGVDADLREGMQMARTLSSLRMDEILAVAPAYAGFPTKTKLIVQLTDQRTLTLEVGAPVPNRAPGREAVYVRTAEQPDRIGTIPALTWSRIRKAFAR